MTIIRQPCNLDWMEGRFSEVPHGFGQGIGIWSVEIPEDVVVVEEAVGCRDMERAERMHSMAERGYFLGSHAVLRAVVARALEQSPTQLEFTSGDFGKPRLADGSLHFNMSRSKSLALIGLSEKRDIGVDIEVVGEVPDAEILAREHLSPQEYEAWCRVEPALAITALLQCWTRKEACLKAVGIGLALSLQDVNVGWADIGIPVRSRIIYRDRHWDMLVASLPMPRGLVAAAALVF